MTLTVGDMAGSILSDGKENVVVRIVWLKNEVLPAGVKFSKTGGGIKSISQNELIVSRRQFLYSLSKFQYHVIF